MPLLTSPPPAVPPTNRPHRPVYAKARAIACFIKLIALFVVLVTATSLTRATTTESVSIAAHPQDGPHAEIRLTVTDEGLRLGVGLNLAFIDQVIPIVRETPGQLVGFERDALKKAVIEWLRSDVHVELDGTEVAPRVEDISLFADPDPAMSAIYPVYGSRALIRIVATLVYESPTPESLALTWPAYPKDTLNAAMEGLSPEETPSLFLEAQFRAQGSPVHIIRFSEAEPTYRWLASEEDSSGLDLPAPPLALEATPARGGPLVRTVGISLIVLGVVVLIFVRTRATRVLGGVVLASGFLAALIGSGNTSGTETSNGPATVPEEQAREIFAALHERMYRAFDFTAESEIYDVLAEAVAGPLLEQVYTEMYTMLLQTEQEGLVGVVTGIELLDVTITPMLDDAPAFEARCQWRVEGTVYHWGHTHTRTHKYDARFVIAPVDGAWHFTQRNILSQHRIGAPSGVVPGEL